MVPCLRMRNWPPSASMNLVHAEEAAHKVAIAGIRSEQDHEQRATRRWRRRKSRTLRETAKASSKIAPIQRLNAFSTNSYLSVIRADQHRDRGRDHKRQIAAISSLPRGQARPGRHKAARMISSGYSATQEKMCCAIRPAKMPPITPPSESQR